MTRPLLLAAALLLLVAGPVLSQTLNQTGAAQVRVATLGADLRVGELLLGRPLVYFNPDAEDAWLGCGILQRYALSIDPAKGRYRLAASSGPGPGAGTSD